MSLPIKYADGTGDQALILLHGLGNNYQSWKNVREYIDTSIFRVYIPDLLGFGDSPKPVGVQYDLSDHADAVIRTIDRLELKDVIMAGHSMGALVALEIAMLRPDLVRHLTLLGAPLYEKMPKKRRLGRILRTESIYFSIFYYLQENPDLVITGSSIAEDVIPQLHGMEINKDTWNAFEKSLSNSIMQTKSFRDLGNIQVPVVMVCGLFDFFVDNRIVKRAAARNKDYVKIKNMLGPHEITPRQGRKVAKLLRSAAKKYGVV